MYIDIHTRAFEEHSGSELCHVYIFISTCKQNSILICNFKLLLALATSRDSRRILKAGIWLHRKYTSRIGLVDVDAAGRRFLLRVALGVCRRILSHRARYIITHRSAIPFRFLQDAQHRTLDSVNHLVIDVSVEKCRALCSHQEKACLPLPHPLWPCHHAQAQNLNACSRVSCVSHARSSATANSPAQTASGPARNVFQPTRLPLARAAGDSRSESCWTVCAATKVCFVRTTLSLSLYTHPTAIPHLRTKTVRARHRITRSQMMTSGAVTRLTSKPHSINPCMLFSQMSVVLH